MVWQKHKQKIAEELKKRCSQLQDKLSPQDWRHYWRACCELFAHYKEVFQFWWAHRDQIKLPDFTAHEAEFLPAALSIQATPVSPAGRWAARILICLLLTLLLWSVIGKVDIVVNGQGKIIAGGHTKTIASVEIAKVVGLYVQEGQSVKAGDVLIELDARGPDSEKNKAQGDRQLALLQMERAKAILGAIGQGTNQTETQSKHNLIEPKLSPIAGVDEVHYQNEVFHLADQWRDFIAKRNRIVSQIKRFGDALPLATQRAKDYQELAKERDVSTHAYLEKEQARIDLQGQFDDAKTQLIALVSETRKTAQEDLYQATRTWSAAVQDINKALARSEQLRITSPVDGVVQQLNIHTVGGVVPAAQPLMLIVPRHHSVEFEAYIENKDIGFIQVGQGVQIKIDAYEYAKYGTIAGIVTHISHDAVDFSGNGTGLLVNKDVDPKKDAGTGAKGLMYAVKVALQKPTIWVDDRQLPLSPGMSASIDIKTGERRIIQYILSPLITHAHESLRER